MLRDDVQLISVDDHVVERAHVFTAKSSPSSGTAPPTSPTVTESRGGSGEDRFYPLSFQANVWRRSALVL